MPSKAAYGWVFVGALLCIPALRAQSSDQDATTSNASKPRASARRVWTNEDLQQLHSHVNVVGKVETEPPAIAGKQAATRTSNAPPTISAPGLRFTATTLDGQEYSSESLRGRVVLVQFWATWCPHCQGDQPAVDRISEAYGDKLVVFAVDDSEPLQKVQMYLAKSPRSCPIVLGKDTDLVSLARGHSGIPYYVVIDANGHIAGTRGGEIGEKGMRALLQRAGI